MPYNPKMRKVRQFMKPKKLYFDPYGNVELEAPAGLYEVWTAREGYEEALERAILSRELSREVFWEKRHTLLRFYVFGVMVVMAWKVKPAKSRISRVRGAFSVSFGRFVLNFVKNEPKKGQK